MPAEPILLAFDTSAAHCAAALLRGSELLACRVEEMGKGQAERLMPMLEEGLRGVGLGWRDLSGIGVGIGPGNFTGIRISVAAARGLALSLGVPAVGVSSLEALAFNVPRPVQARIDARRGLAYVQDFTAEGAQPPELVEWAALEGHDGPVADTISPEVLIEAIARIAAERIASGADLPRPAPLYLRGADAAPPSDPPPVILD
ncbi:tRNA (adenosine(37)-N6)-threonylcarbamoyltransferase complex dimerization subunit type 1 TsaB [Pseudothioclava arenosa]|uniref:tRNA (Adenosine(37)-N6)-threonylcarbamoyltransferase complex dimerization subunit type 1 TsaB n=1 Tax=Pseudothioclava arenosa TaxID=1795308 RepID=A0A2A4CTW1_9RHOB|nr:tRNA (adenosine(37)-N6)-threonylcarbamoyltransferase complex dimerization subunit type 1 TsaB [Pseudothioclava arenosa]PCD77790.1 tRNA (adenosine(37)-N6)-threonylcarbamoyltransferase complex dimerization subunit type 1 TsaB [Pseudothioclava arenosa]